MRAVPDQIARWVPGDYTSLGTDGFGFADTRGAARRFFHVDAESIVVAVLEQLARRGEVKADAPRAGRRALPATRCQRGRARHHRRRRLKSRNVTPRPRRPVDSQVEDVRAAVVPDRVEELSLPAPGRDVQLRDQDLFPLHGRPGENVAARPDDHRPAGREPLVGVAVHLVAPGRSGGRSEARMHSSRR